jgi:transposase-like protein
MNHISDTGSRPRRVHRSADQWAQLIDAQSTSGLSVTAFCREHGLAANSFHRWRRRFEDSAAPRSGQHPFVRLRMSADDGVPARRSSSAISDHDLLVVRFVDGVELHVAGERLRQVLTLLRDGSGHQDSA